MLFWHFPPPVDLVNNVFDSNSEKFKFLLFILCSYLVLDPGQKHRGPNSLTCWMVAWTAKSSATPSLEVRPSWYLSIYPPIFKIGLGIGRKAFENLHPFILTILKSRQWLSANGTYRPNWVFFQTWLTPGWVGFKGWCVQASLCSLLKCGFSFGFKGFSGFCVWEGYKRYWNTDVFGGIFVEIIFFDLFFHIKNVLASFQHRVLGIPIAHVFNAF